MPAPEPTTAELLAQAQAVFGYTRLMVAAFGIGAGWEAMDRAIPYSAERIQAGSPLSEKQATAMIDRLRARALIDGVRGRPGIDRPALVKVVRGLCALMDGDETGPVNMGNPHEVTILELAETVKRLTNSPSELVFREAGQGVRTSCSRPAAGWGRSAYRASHPDQYP